jgi:hypothetical protein
LRVVIERRFESAHVERYPVAQFTNLCEAKLLIGLGIALSAHVQALSVYQIIYLFDVFHACLARDAAVNRRMRGISIKNLYNGFLDRVAKAYEASLSAIEAVHDFSHGED